MHLVYEDYIYEYSCSDFITCSDSLICGYISTGNLEGYFVHYNVKGYYGYIEYGKGDRPLLEDDDTDENYLNGGVL